MGIRKKAGYEAWAGRDVLGKADREDTTGWVQESWAGGRKEVGTPDLCLSDLIIFCGNAPSQKGRKT